MLNSQLFLSLCNYRPVLHFEFIFPPHFQQGWSCQENIPLRAAWYQHSCLPTLWMQPLSSGCVAHGRCVLQPHEVTDSLRESNGRTMLFKLNNNNDNNLNIYKHAHTLYVTTVAQKYCYFVTKCTGQVNKSHFYMGCLGTRSSGCGFLLPEMRALGDEVGKVKRLTAFEGWPRANWSSETDPKGNFFKSALEEWLWRKEAHNLPTWCVPNWIGLIWYFKCNLSSSES